MELLVAAANDQSGQAVRLIVILLLVVAGGLTVLTIWYWRFTDPRRHTSLSAESVVSESVAHDGLPVADAPPVAEVAYVPAVTGQMPVVTLTDQPGGSPVISVGSDSTDGELAGSGLIESASTDRASRDMVPPPQRPDKQPTLPLPQESEPEHEPDSEFEFEFDSEREVHQVVSDSVLDDAVKTGEINLTDSQWDQLAEAVLGAIGWDEPNPPDEESAASSDAPVAKLATPDPVHSVGVVD